MTPAAFQEFRSELLGLCLASIRHGIDTGRVIRIDPDAFDPALKVLRATFVTLMKNGNLRGCIGSLQAIRPLVVDLARNAYASAFSDPRFEQVSAKEMDALHIQLSILSEPETMNFSSESDLVKQLQPGIDGLILEDSGRQGTFLPSVWESFPEPRDFLNQLKRKAGLAENYWSDRIEIARYSTETIAGPA
ncbi:MAG: AmmeMemoRadiSam system protein A [Methylococcales bacterium]